MPNEEIMTSLRNAVEHGDSLQNAIQIMINSGYDPQEVEETSRYIGEGVFLKNQSPEEEVVMPGTKKKKDSLFSKINPLKKEKTVPIPQPIQKSQGEVQEFQAKSKYFQPNSLQRPIFQNNNRYKQPSFQQRQSLAAQLKKIQPPRKFYIKEIILLTILIILIGILITTIIFRDEILKFFSG